LNDFLFYLKNPFDRIYRIIQDYFFILFQFPDETGKTQSALSRIK
jgi:hypothetical protein